MLLRFRVVQQMSFFTKLAAMLDHGTLECRRCGWTEWLDVMPKPEEVCYRWQDCYMRMVRRMELRNE